MSFLVNKKNPDFHNFQRRLKEKTLAAVGAVHIISDQFTDDDSVIPMLNQVMEASAHLTNCKDKIAAHMNAMKALPIFSRKSNAIAYFHIPPRNLAHAAPLHYIVIDGPHQGRGYVGSERRCWI